MKILGIGTDIVSIKRIQAIWDRFGETFARKILTPAEIRLFMQAKEKVPFLAKRFAAKEAVAKAFGTGFRPNGLLLTEIGILNDEWGRPYLQFRGRTETLINSRAILATHVSISDEAEFALAFVIFEG
jgi:holo-[acyl-carrier protein] synthase